jgi:hypothetical protein
MKKTLFISALVGIAGFGGGMAFSTRNDGELTKAARLVDIATTSPHTRVQDIVNGGDAVIQLQNALPERAENIQDQAVFGAFNMAYTGTYEGSPKSKAIQILNATSKKVDNAFGLTEIRMQRQATK